MDVYLEMGRRLRGVRETRHLSQEVIAELLNTSQQVYSRYELGQQKIPLRHIITLAQFYNLSADYLLGLIDAPRPLGEPSDG